MPQGRPKLSGKGSSLGNLPRESLSRDRSGQLPVLEHLLSEEDSRALSLAVDDDHIYAGTSSETNSIVVYDRNRLQKLKVLNGHQGSVLALLLVQEKKWLFSGSSDGTVKVWCTEKLELIYEITPASGTSGDIYCLGWDPRQGGTLYFGDQATDIEYLNFNKVRDPSETSYFQNLALATSTGRSNRVFPHKFFNNNNTSKSKADTRASTPIPLESDRTLDRTQSTPANVKSITIPTNNVISSAHYGYIYCMQMINRPDGTWWMVSGSGDADVKIWKCLPSGGLEEVFAFTELPGAVLSLAYRDSLLFGGLQEGQIKVWDLETGSCIRTILAHDSDVMSMAIAGTDLYAAGANGAMFRFDSSFDRTATFQAHQFAILSTVIIPSVDGKYGLISAGRRFIKLWTLPRIHNAIERSSQNGTKLEGPSIDGDMMLYGLAKLIAVPTVSDDAHREDCRQGAHLLKRLLTQMGGESRLLHSIEGKNPLVMAKFQGHDNSGKPRKRVLFYGHYDIQPAREPEWTTDPFELSGRNGYLYGRGVSDNKGPILAVACAAAALRERRMLDVDLVMIIEGEEEAGSAGFVQAMHRHKEDIGHIDTILLSNSSWIGEDDPCVVFGLRGVVYANLNISSKNADAHSGVDGGAVEEPMLAMIKLLSKIEDEGKVKVPKFYNDVASLKEEEKSYYEAVAHISGIPVETVLKKWREPTFSVANILASGPANNTIIPRSVTANVSFRLVPNQSLDDIASDLQAYCQSTFKNLNNDMELTINITHRASWWLASPENVYFQTLENAIEKIWGKKPLKIREGGSIPTIPFLEDLFHAPCVHLPLGQHSSNAHLSNERLRLLNLRNGKKVIEEFLINVGHIGETAAAASKHS